MKIISMNDSRHLFFLAVRIAFVKKQKHMKTTTTSADHLLDTSLEGLHSQTLGWMKTVDFWKEEGKFFYNLLRKKELRPVFPDHEIAILEKEIIRITADELDPFKLSLAAHERLLKSYFTHPTGSQEKEYRVTHRDLLYRVTVIEDKIRLFKQRVFSFIKSDTV